MKETRCFLHMADSCNLPMFLTYFCHRETRLRSRGRQSSVTWLLPIFVTALVGIPTALLTYGYTQAPKIDYTLGFNGVCAYVPKTLYFYPNGQTQQVSLCSRDRGPSDTVVVLTVTAGGATLLCNGVNQTSCQTTVILFGGSQDYGSNSFTFAPNSASKQFTLTYSLAKGSGTFFEDDAALFAEMNGFFPLSVTYNETAQYTYTLAQ